VTTNRSAEVVALDGPDALTYLQGQVSQDLADLQGSGTVRTLLLDPNGTLVAVATVVAGQGDVVTLEVPDGLGAAVRTRLERFAIREDVTFHGPDHLDAPHDAALADERARIDARIPGPRELAAGLVAHGLDASLLAECVSFTKGCYPGQELVARMQARGAMPPYVLRHVTTNATIEVDAPAGDASFEGRVTSVAEAGSSTWHALCVLHRRDAAGDEVDVHSVVGEVRARLD
jgi:tRNA-modifying protein YgfZ